MKHYPDYPKVHVRPVNSQWGNYVVHASEVTRHYFHTIEEATAYVRLHNGQQKLKRRSHAST